MFCLKCGKQIDDNASTCPYCGASVLKNESSNQTVDSSSNPKVDVTNSSFNKEVLKQDRGLFSFIILTIVTFGIYYFYYIYKLGHDINIACAGDGKRTAGLFKFILLTPITLFIYPLVWECGVANRLANNGIKYGVPNLKNGTSVFLWAFFGSFLCGIGPFVAWHIIIKNTNKICSMYNAR